MVVVDVVADVVAIHVVAFVDVVVVDRGQYEPIFKPNKSCNFTVDDGEKYYTTAANS